MPALFYDALLPRQAGVLLEVEAPSTCHARALRGNLISHRARKPRLSLERSPPIRAAYMLLHSASDAGASAAAVVTAVLVGCGLGVLFAQPVIANNNGVVPLPIYGYGRFPVGSLFSSIDTRSHGV